MVLVGAAVGWGRKAISPPPPEAFYPEGVARRAGGAFSGGPLPPACGGVDMLAVNEAGDVWGAGGGVSGVSLFFFLLNKIFLVRGSG